EAKFSLTVYSAFTLDGYSGSCTITIGTGDVASRGRCVVPVVVATARRLPQRGRRVRIVSSGAARPRHDPPGRQKTGRMTGTTRQRMGGKKLWETICSAESGALARVTARGIERQFPAVPGCRRTWMPPSSRAGPGHIRDRVSRQPRIAEEESRVRPALWFGDCSSQLSRTNPTEVEWFGGPV